SRVLSNEAGEPGALSFVEGKDLDEGRPAVEGLILGNRACDLSRARIAQLRRLAERMKRREKVRAETAKQAERRPDRDVAEVDERRDIDDLDFENIPGLCALDFHRTSQRVHLREVESENAGRRQRPRRRADVQRVPAQELDSLALTNRGDARQVLVETVVQ